MDKKKFSTKIYRMKHKLEEETAEMLVALASDIVSTYYDAEDWDAGIIAVLARAIETASGRTLKPLEMIWTQTIS